MKKFLVILIILLLIGGGFFTYKYIQNKKEEARISEIKKGWYLEILTDELNVREKGSKNSNLLKTVKKGDIFKVLDVEVLGNFKLFRRL